MVNKKSSLDRSKGGRRRKERAGVRAKVKTTSASKAPGKARRENLPTAPAPAAVAARVESKPAEPARTAPASPSQRLFPIVGIGASAGGLEALETFLKN